MSDNDFSRLGKEIREGIQEAVNSAVGSMDFSRLSEVISGTVDKAVNEVSEAINGALEGRFGQKEPGSDFSYTGASDGEGAADNSGRQYSRSDREGESDRGYRSRSARGCRGTYGDSLPGRVGGILMTVFGGIGIAGFGIPALVLLAIGLPLHSFLLMELSLIAFLPLTVGSGLLLKKGQDKLGRVRRFEAYKRCIGAKSLCAIRSLSSAVGKPEKYVCGELETLIVQGYFPQGHIDDERTCLILDDETYQLYRQSKVQMQRAASMAGESPDDTGKGEESRKPGTKPSTEQEKQLRAAMETGMEYIRQIRKNNDELTEPVITEKLTHLEEVIGLIFMRVEKTPEKLSSLKRFTDYYLPTTLRLVEAYRDFDRSQMQTDNIIESKKQIEETLDTINAAFDKLLDSLYEEDRMNIQTDITVLRTLLAQEGLTDDGLHCMDDIFAKASGNQPSGNAMMQ